MNSIGTELRCTQKACRRGFERAVRWVLYKVNSHCFNIDRPCILATKKQKAQ